MKDNPSKLSLKTWLRVALSLMTREQLIRVVGFIKENIVKPEKTEKNGG